jgi:hypothetical protein
MFAAAIQGGVRAFLVRPRDESLHIAIIVAR